MHKQPPPLAVLQALRSRGVAPHEIVHCTDTDIDLAGRYRPQWLIVTRDELIIAVEEPQPTVQLALAWTDIDEVRTQAVVGSGLLQVREQGVFIDVLRFSNRLAQRFADVARLLDQHRRGEPLDADTPGESEPAGDTVPKRAVILRMIRLMAGYRRAALMMMAVLFAGIFLDLAAPQLTRILVDTILPGSAEEVSRLQAQPERFDEHLRMLLLVVAALVVIQLLRAVLQGISGVLTSNVGTAMTFDIRRRLVSHLERLSIGYYDRQNVGALVGRVAYDTEALHGFTSQLTSGFLFQLILVVGVGAMMFAINPLLAAWTLIPAPLIIVGSTIFWRYIYPRYYRLWDASTRQAGALSGMLTGIRVVKAFGQEQREARRFDHISHELRSSRVNLDKASSVFNPVMGVVFQLGGWIIWFVGGRNVLQGDMTLGELMAFFGYLWMFYGPLGSLTQFTNWLTQFVTQAHRIFEILDAPIQIAESENPIEIDTLRGDVAFRNVTFGYNRNNPVLRGVSFNIYRGEMIGVVGRSGSGKTTLVNLLCRFYDADEGAVLLDDINVRDMRLADLRRQIGIVLQEPFLFQGSIWDNITYGRPTDEAHADASDQPAATPEAVLAAARAANCHDFIMRQPHGYDTWVGERGAGLSGGERQRISIARVLLTDPRILILDEATSSVDTESESAIQAGIAALVRGRTTIAIAHRLSTLRNADRILVLDNGAIIESGSHDELLAQDGLYAQLVRLQGATNEIQEELLTAALTTRSGSVESSASAFRSDDGWRSPAPDAPADPLPHYLTPDNAAIQTGRRNTLRVTLDDGRAFDGVYVLRCLPVHHPDGYLSLRCLDEEKREIELGIIRRLADWPAIQQELVRHALARRYLMHTIHAIHQIRSANGLLHFDVETDLGPIQFTMRPDPNRTQDYGRQGKVLLDLDDNHYLVPDVSALPPADRRLFRRHIYWSQ